ncbi:MAG: aminotransferase class III-fold pyridoxal phosphate-dependent enzyme, partial [Anaerolineales bacterium]|nr:aminotransferase class III-fold pyridoxal phosphate-dependent enzyme [Anaerolineales bacterium]
IRGLGLMIGIELKHKVTPVLKELQQRGILALPAGNTVLRLLPPLIIEQHHVDRVIDTVIEVLSNITKSN